MPERIIPVTAKVAAQVRIQLNIEEQLKILSTALSFAQDIIHDIERESKKLNKENPELTSLMEQASSRLCNTNSQTPEETSY